MNTIKQNHSGTICIVCTAVMLFHYSSQAVPNLRITVEGSDVVLRWPSQPQAAYIVQYRPTLWPDTPWATLASNHPSGGQNDDLYARRCI